MESSIDSVIFVMVDKCGHLYINIALFWAEENYIPLRRGSSPYSCDSKSIFPWCRKSYMCPYKLFFLFLCT